MSPIPIAPNLFITKPVLRLLGGRHRDTGRIVFPLPDDPVFETIELPPQGRLWSFTIQRFAPKSPPYRGGGASIPFAVGYVELAGALIVESRLTDVAFDGLRVGMPMELTTVNVGDDTDERQAYAFKPAAGAGSAP